jgi:acetyl esterase/lipase
MRRSGLRNRILPLHKLDQWKQHPRTLYTGLPGKRVLRRIEVQRTEFHGFPLYRVTPRLPEQQKLNGHMIYLHGGAYVMDFIPAVHWPLIARLANLLRRSITVPIYPLAPEHTYRDVFPLLLAIYRRILDDFEPDAVMFAGDSAGGGMALGLCHALRDAGIPQPRDALLLSPWMHVGFPNPRAAAVARIDPALSIDALRVAGERYAGGAPLDFPLISPGAGPLGGLPRLTIFTGTHDVLNPDTRDFHRRALAAGVQINWHERRRAMHCWMVMPGRAGTAAFDTMRHELGA